MPVQFDEYEAEDDLLRLEEGSNAYKILTFLAEHSDQGFTPKEIHKETDVPRGSIGTTLARLEERQLVQHKEPYWAAGKDDRLAAYSTMLTSMEDIENHLPPEDKDEWLENAEDPRNQ